MKPAGKADNGAAASASAEDFARDFAQAWQKGDSRGIGALFTPDATFMTLTGVWCEDRAAIEAAAGAEFEGIFARARLVTGRGRLRLPAPSVGLLTQRFVLSGLRHSDGSDAGRVAAVLTAVLNRDAEGGWLAVAGHFSAEA